ncbi:MAG: HAD family hydrolase [Fimbriimonadaceae bacterium]|nr:HAD family hydrolase [Fimbriimonadaceae bacterium]
MVIFVDVDDTLVRSAGSKRMPMPGVVRHVRELKEQGAELYCWSSGGGEYARQSAQELGISDCFVAFLPKPEVMIDDQAVADWRRCITVHPSECAGRSVEDYQDAVAERSRSGL